MSKRKDIEVFNISFLDLLSGALGAVIFLFIVVPKGGGESPALQPQLSVSYDTVQGRFFGEIPDSLMGKFIGDSLMAVIVDFKNMPGIDARTTPRPTPTPRRTPIAKTPESEKEKSIEKIADRIPAERIPSREISPPSPRTSTASRQPTKNYSGPMPSVPCSFSVELKWEEAKDNVDLFLCKDGDCVFGGRRFREAIGYWDSGKSRTSIFGGDLRTSQEAVRQFEKIIPGEYVILAQYKDSPEPKDRLPIEGLVDANSPEKGESGERFHFTLPRNERERTRSGTLNVEADGSHRFELTHKN